jgi:hypothetical protein
MWDVSKKSTKILNVFLSSTKQIQFPTLQYIIYSYEQILINMLFYNAKNSSFSQWQQNPFLIIYHLFSAMYYFLTNTCTLRIALQIMS